MLAVKVVAAMAAVPKAHVEKASAATVSAATVSAATVSAATVSAAMVSAATVNAATVRAAIDDPVADEIAKTTVAVEIVQSVAIVVPSLARPAASHREPTPPKQSVAGPISVRRVRRDQKVRHRRHSPAKRVATTSRHAAVVPSVVPNSLLSATSLGTSATNLGTSAANLGTSVAASHAIVAVSPDESRRLPIQQRLPRKWNPCAAVARPPHHREVLPIRVSVVVVVAVVVVDAAVIAHSPARTAAAPSRRPLTSPIRRVSPQTQAPSRSTLLVAPLTQALSRSTLLVAPLTRALSRSTLLVAPLTRALSRLQPRLDRADRRPVVVKTQPQTPRAQVMPTWTATMTMQAQRSSACVRCPR